MSDKNHFLKKKAQIGMGMKPIIGIIIAIIVILATISVFMALLGIFTGKADQQTLGFYSAFMEGVNAMESSPDGSACFFQASLDEDWPLVLFDADETSTEEQCGSNDIIMKPGKCGGPKKTRTGCACICNGGTGDIDDEDCNEKGTECTRLGSFKFFKYPYHDSYGDDAPEGSPADWAWWEGMDVAEWGWESSGNYHLTESGVVIYNKQCGGSVWNSGSNLYVLKRIDADRLLIKRVPEGKAINDVKVSAVDLKNGEESVPRCRDVYESQLQDTQSAAQNVQK